MNKLKNLILYPILSICLLLVNCTNSMKEKMSLEQNGIIKTEKILKVQEKKIAKNSKLGPKTSNNTVPFNQTRIAEASQPKSRILDDFFIDS